MTPYEAGFAAGEREAFFDRRHGMPKLRPPEDSIRGPYGHGYWDAYVPRSLTWRLVKAPAPSWQDEPEEAA